jgi:hypothetical protein
MGRSYPIKSATKKTYKINGEIFLRTADIAKKFSVAQETARLWVKKKRTGGGDRIAVQIIIVENAKP